MSRSFALGSGEEVRPARRRSSIAWVLIGALCSLALVAQLYITAEGAGVSPDSTRYLSTASNFAAGNGLVHFGDDGTLVPLKLWPPAYPIVLSLASATVEQASRWGRILNALLFGANAFVLFLIIRRGLGGRWVPALIGASFFLVSPDLTEIHVWIWSEPLMVLAGSLSLLLVDRFIETHRLGFLVLGAILAGLSVLTRYAAVAYVAAGAVGLMTFDPGRVGNRRFGHVLVYLALALGPIVIWAGRGGDISGNALSRGIQVNESAAAELGNGMSIVSDWFLPGRIEEPLRSRLTRGILLGWLALLLWALGIRGVDRRRSGAQPRTYLPELLALFVFFYALVLIVVKFFVSPGISISPRIFSPGLVALIGLTTMAVTLAFDRFLSWRRSRLSRWSTAGGSLIALGVAALILLGSAMNATRSIAFAQKVHAEGLGYTDVSWRVSPVLRYLRALPPDVAIVTNGTDVIYFLTGRQARMLPAWPEPDPTGGAVRPEDLATIERRVHPGDVLVYFRGFRGRPTMNERQIHQAFDLKALVGDANASAYQVEGITFTSFRFIPRALVRRGLYPSDLPASAPIGDATGGPTFSRSQPDRRRSNPLSARGRVGNEESFCG